MKIKALISLLVVSWLLSLSAWAEDATVTPQAGSGPDNGGGSVPNKKNIDEATPSGNSSANAAPQASATTPSAGSSAGMQADLSKPAGTDKSLTSGNSSDNSPENPGVVRVPYVPEVVRREIKEEIKQEVLAQARGERWGDPGALPDWLSRISWYGDFRLRYQRDSFPSGNALPAQYNPVGLTLISNTTNTHDYLQIMAHLGMNVRVSDYTFAAFRLSTGTTTTPSTENQTLGYGFNKDTVLFDRAYVQSAPYDWLTLSGGKMPNPWLSTNLLWDPTVNFDGVAAQVRQKILEEWRWYLTAGAFPYQNIQQSDTVLSNSKWLYAAQLGGTWTGIDSSTAQLGIALYDYRAVEGIPNEVQGSHLYDGTAAQSMQKGNSLMYVNAPGDPYLYGLASKFHELDVTARMDWATYDPVHVMLTGDYVRNLGFNASEIASRTGLPAPTAETTGYQLALDIGSPRVKQRGEWQASVAYKYLQRDAVLDSLTDSLFHLGGTNAKGFIIGGTYGLDKETNVNVRWMSSDQIDGPPLSIDSVIVDLNVRF